MKIWRTFTMLVGLSLLLALFSPLAEADEWDKTTKVTFHESVQVPGKVLPAGTYVFKLLDSSSNRHVVQIFNEDHTQLITTILAVPNQRLEPAGKTILTYEERPADQPMALAAWFYPGDNFGQEFVYPKSEAEQLSKLNNKEVPSTESEEAYPKLQERTETASQNPTPPAEPQASVPATNPAPTTPPAAQSQLPPRASQPENNQVAAQRTQLPHTASPLPLLALSGFLFLALAVALRLRLRT